MVNIIPGYSNDETGTPVITIRLVVPVPVLGYNFRGPNQVCTHNCTPMAQYCTCNHLLTDFKYQLVPIPQIPDPFLGLNI